MTLMMGRSNDQDYYPRNGDGEGQGHSKNVKIPMKRSAQPRHQRKEI